MNKRLAFSERVFFLLALMAILIPVAVLAVTPEKGADAVLPEPLARASTNSGHPSAEDAPFMASEMPAWLETRERGGTPVQIPALSPLINGPFVNFESPQVKPLALTDDGSRLFAANTPNNSLLVLDAAGSLAVLDEIPVGLEPVTVAVQPGSNGNLVWVANFISDNISVVDIALGTVVDVIDVGDEPVNIVFGSGGRWAFVVVQGIGPGDVSSIDPENPLAGNVVVVEVDSRTVTSTTFLDMNTPRAAIYDAQSKQLVVAALHSGNNTTVVGKQILLDVVGVDDRFVNILEIVRDFPATAGLFGSTPGLGVWPDPHVDPTFDPSPLVHRIIDDIGSPGGWKDIIDIFSDENGQPDPDIVADVESFFQIVNGFDVVATIIADAKDTLDHDLVVLNVASPSDITGLPIVAHVENVGTTLTGIGRNPLTGNLFVSDMNARNVVRHVQNLRGHIVDHRVVLVSDAGGSPVVSPVDLHEEVPGFNDASAPNQLAKDMSLANPLDIVFDPSGDTAFVVSLSANRIGALDGATGRVVGRVDVGRGPRGIALDHNNDRLFVLNRTDQSISVVDVADRIQMQVERTVNLFNPEPQEIQDGRDFLYSSKRANNASSACATCHIDGTLDHIAWDLGDPTGGMQPGPPNLSQLNHPIKGPMVTQSLMGLRNHTPLHWRGDKPVFQDFNEAFPNLLGTDGELTTADMDAFAAYVNTISYPPNPFYDRDNTFRNSSRAENGAGLYITFCDGCHQVFVDVELVDGHDGALKGSDFDPPADGDIGISLQGIFGQLQIIPQLRDLHQKFQNDKYTGFGLIHDGREEREDNNHPMQTFLNEFFPEANTGIGPNDQLDMIAFLNAFPSNVMNVVGWQVMHQVDSAARRAADATADVNLMVGQFGKDPSHCDVIAKGVVAGEARGYVLVADDPAVIFETDLGDAITLDGLLASVADGESLVFTAVPPGSGRRMGVDQDEDCLSDGLDAQPQSNNQADPDYDGEIGISDFLALFDCSLLDGPLPAECRVFDFDCDGVLADIDFNGFVSLYPGPTDDCNGNSTNDLLDILAGVSVDANGNATPDECETANAPIVSDPITKNRYISFEPNNEGTVALHVRMTAGPGLTGDLGWVGPPDAQGISRVVELPHFDATWPARIDLGDCEIVPASTYEVRATINGEDFTIPAVIHTTPQPTPQIWADCVGTFEDGKWSAPNGVVNFIDISACVLGFQEALHAPALPRLDLEGEVPNKRINFADIQQMVFGFQGAAYPYSDPADCP